MRLTLPNGTQYLSSKWLVHALREGAGAIAQANIETLCELAGNDVMTIDPERVIGSYGHYHYNLITFQENPAFQALAARNPVLLLADDEKSLSRQLWIRADSDLAATALAGLNESPAISQEAVDRVKEEWELQAWNTWLKRDLAVVLEKRFGFDAVKAFEHSQGENLMFEAYLEAKAQVKPRYNFGYATFTVDTSRLAPKFTRRLSPALETRFIKKALVDLVGGPEALSGKKLLGVLKEQGLVSTRFSLADIRESSSIDSKQAMNLWAMRAVFQQAFKGCTSADEVARVNAGRSLIGAEDARRMAGLVPEVGRKLKKLKDKEAAVGLTA